MQVAFPKKVYTYVVLKTNLGYFLQKIGWDKSQTSPSIPPGLTPKQEEEKMELSPKAKPRIRKVRTSRGHLSVEKRTILETWCTSYFFQEQYFSECSSMASVSKRLCNFSCTYLEKASYKILSEMWGVWLENSRRFLNKLQMFHSCRVLLKVA